MRLRGDRSAMDPEETIEAYYAALRAGEPLEAFFAERPTSVKVGISERLVGFDAIAAALREQTRTTTDWDVESRDRHVDRRGPTAWFGDDVRMAWTEIESGRRHAFDSRWSGTLERDGDDGWAFVGMHVSAPHGL